MQLIWVRVSNGHDFSEWEQRRFFMYVAGTDKPYWCYETSEKREKLGTRQWSEFSLTNPNTTTKNEPMTRQEEIQQLEARLAELKQGKTWEDLGTVSGWYVNEVCDLVDIRGVFTSPNSRCVYATKEQAEAFGIASPQLTQLVKDKRGGWEPDWKDGSTNKYVPSINKEGIFIEVFTWSARPFALPTRELCNEFIKLHSELLLTYFNGTTS